MLSQMLPSQRSSGMHISRKPLTRPTEYRLAGVAYKRGGGDTEDAIEFCAARVAAGGVVVLLPKLGNCHRLLAPSPTEGGIWSSTAFLGVWRLRCAAS